MFSYFTSVYSLDKFVFSQRLIDFRISRDCTSYRSRANLVQAFLGTWTPESYLIIKNYLDLKGISKFQSNPYQNKNPLLQHSRWVVSIYLKTSISICGEPTTSWGNSFYFLNNWSSLEVPLVLDSLFILVWSQNMLLCSFDLLVLALPPRATLNKLSTPITFPVVSSLNKISPAPQATQFGVWWPSWLSLFVLGACWCLSKCGFQNCFDWWFD